MQIGNRSSMSQLTDAASVDKTPEASGWKPGAIAGKVAGKIGSIFGFKATVASPQQQSGRVAQNNTTKQEIESKIAGIDQKLESLTTGATSTAISREADPVKQAIMKDKLRNAKITLGQEKGQLLEKLASKDYALSANSSKTSTPAASRSPSPVTVSRPPSPTTRSQDAKQAEEQQYQTDKKQIAVNERLMDQPGGIYSATQKSQIAQDTWDRQLRVDQYEKKHP